MDNHLYDFGPKVLVETFNSADFIGRYYDNGILEIFDGDELIDTLYWIEAYRAEYMFEYHYGDQS